MLPKKALQFLIFLFHFLRVFGEFIEQTVETLFQIKICILDIVIELSIIDIF